MNIILASASPRRQELLHLAVKSFDVISLDVDENTITAPSPVLLCQKIAAAKCAAVASSHNSDIVIGCDTIVDVDGTVLGKPANKNEALQFITLLAARAHLVHTGVCICQNGEYTSFCESTKVIFEQIPEAEILQYINTNEPYDKAGAYGIQGWAAKYISRIEGCYFNVMGLPVSKLFTTLQNLKIL